MEKRKVLTLRNILITALVILLGIALWQIIEFPEKERPYTRQEVVLDTGVSITVYDADRSKAERAVARAFERVREIEKISNRFDSESEIYEINSVAGAETAVSPELLDMLRISRDYYDMTGGAFDVTVAPIMDVWNFGGEARIPSGQEIAETLAYVDMSQIKIDDAAGTVLLPDGYNLDLGGVAKGYAAEEAVAVLRSAGIESGLVDTGSTAVVLGSKPGGQPWKIGLQHPRFETGEVIGAISVENANISTSGDYQRYFYKDGKNYHHIIDPETGYPADELISVTVVCERGGAKSDILSTALFVMGETKAREFLEANDDVEGVLINKDGEVYVTEGLLNRTEGIPPRVDI